MARRIIGTDVSLYQDDPDTPQEIDFVRMNQAADFVIIRAGQNLWVDSDFKNNWRRAREAKLPRGSYWYFDSRADPRQQAELWFNQLGGDMGELPLFLDLEENYQGPFTGWQHWKTFLERLRVLVGPKEIGIYTAFSHWKDNAPPDQTNELEYFHRYPLWIANYSVTQPLVPKPWGTNEWLFWQFTSNGDGPAYGAENKAIDLDYFNGDAEAFAQRFKVPVPGDPIPPDPVGTRYRVTAGSLYVREGPGTTFKAIGSLLMNEIVEALEFSADRGWVRGRRLTDGLTGWSSSTYLEKVDTTPPPPPTGDKYRVTASRLFIREGPGTEFPSLGLLEFNEVVTSIGANPDATWRQIRRSDGLTGWSSASYLVLVPPTPAPDPNEPPPEDVTGNWYRVTRKINARNGAGTSFIVVGLLDKDEVVEALGTNSDQSWIRFRRVDGGAAWASGEYLTNVGRTPDSITQKVFRGVAYYRITQTSPHPMVAHVLAIDIRFVEALRFLVTPPLLDTIPQLCTRTTSQFLDDNNMQIAINGDEYHYLDPKDFPPQDYCASGDPVSPASYAASRGRVYSQKQASRPTLYINEKNEITFDTPKGKVYNAISGERILVAKGKKISGLDAQQLQPRTAIGVNKNGRWLHLIVVDGREASQGASFSQLADMFISYGVHTAMNFDGGGSSTMVIEGVDGRPRVLNTPVDENIPGRERAVANHLGISVKK